MTSAFIEIQNRKNAGKKSNNENEQQGNPVTSEMPSLRKSHGSDKSFADKLMFPEAGDAQKAQ